jgi:hypothetical protein
MKLIRLTVLALVCALHPLLAQEIPSPHQMTNPDGTVDMDKCPICHEPDMTLSRSKVETCTLCHTATPHSGAAEHLAAKPGSVAKLLPPDTDSELKFPLTNEGGIYCGTCHLFHDPVLPGPKPLARAWSVPASGLPGAVASSLESQWKAIDEKYGETAPGAELDTKGTSALRLPINDGSLCRHCHGSMQ